MSSIDIQRDVNTNISMRERVLSGIGGGVLLGFSLARPAWWKLPVALAGGYLLYSGITGSDPIVRLAGIERGKMKGLSGIPVVHSVTIDRPRHEVYQYFRDFQNLPRFMHHLRSVTVRDEGGLGSHSHWIARAPLKQSVEWDAVMTEDQANERIAWQSVEGSQVEHRGEVSFRDAPGERGTEIIVRMVYRIPGGSTGALVAALFGEEPEMQIRGDLGRLKQMMETGVTATVKGQTSGRKGQVNKERRKVTQMS